MDPRQRQRLGWIVRFFALLLVLTLIARGTAGATMPVVTVQKPSSGSVTKSVRTTGTVNLAGGTPFTVPTGLLVLSVLVQAGQTVRAGDALAIFDKDEVDRAVNAKRAALQQALTQAAQQEKGDTADSYAAQAALDAAEEALYSAQKSAEAANAAALSAAQSAEDSRNAALHALENEEEATAKQNALDRAAAAVTAADAATLQAELDALLTIQQAGAILPAPTAGTLTAINLQAGQTTPAVGGMLAENTDFTLEVPLSEDEAKLVSVGTVLQISQSKARGTAAVASLSVPDSDGSVTAKATLGSGNWTAGAAAVTATIQGEKQPYVATAAAIHQSNTGYYVLSVEEHSTILGTQNVVLSLPVTVIETGDTTAAVSGTVDNTTQIIVSSTRAVQAGDRVKIDAAS